MKKRQKLLPLSFTFVILLLSFGAFYWMNQAYFKTPIEQTSALAQEVQGKEESKQVDMKSLIHEAEKSVVQIEATNETGRSIGSGFLYNQKGDIVTNAHVVKGYETIYVKTADARMHPAAVLGVGQNTDIALLRVPQLANRTPMELDLNAIGEIGDDVIAIGSPLGLQNTVSMGIISGADRELTIDEFTYTDAYQISAPITHGNSGGPLIHQATGQVLAINSAGADTGSIGFSIPIKQVKNQLDQWSKEADSKDLTYETSRTKRNLTPTQLKEDANYLFHYFYESILMRDYFSAYAMLGSEWQSKTTYQEFRDQFIHTIDLQVKESSLAVDEKNQVHVSLKTEEVVHNQQQQKVTKTYRITLTIGYENDQFKLLDGQRELISTEEGEQAQEG